MTHEQIEELRARASDPDDFVETREIHALCDMALRSLDSEGQGAGGTLPGKPLAADMVLVPREPTEAMLRAALDTRYGRSRRSRMVKVNFPEAYETWMRAGLAEDAPAIRDEYRAAVSAAMKEPKA